MSRSREDPQGLLAGPQVEGLIEDPLLVAREEYAVLRMEKTMKALSAMLELQSWMIDKIADEQWSWPEERRENARIIRSLRDKIVTLAGVDVDERREEGAEAHREPDPRRGQGTGGRQEDDEDAGNAD